MSAWKIVGGIAGGAIGFFAGGPAGAVAGASIGYGMGASADAANAQEDAANNQFHVDPNSNLVDPRTGVGTGMFGLTDQELARQRATVGTDYNQLQQQQRQINAQADAYAAQWKAQHASEFGGMTSAVGTANMMNALAKDPGYQQLLEHQRQVNTQMQQLGPIDMSDQARFAAMADAAQGRQGQTINRFGVDKTAAPDMVDMNRTAAPGMQEMQRFGVDRFNAEQFDIDPNAGQQDYQHAQDVRNKNIEVMGAVQDRAMGRGGPSVAELQMKQGQDRAIAQQAALAASGGQMDYAQARRQAMLGAADIGQKTASDTAVLRANEQIAAQQTFGGMANAQQSSDLNARLQTMNQANQRAGFLSNQSLQNAQFQAQQAQYASGLAAQQERDALNSRVQQGQFNAQFGLSQEQEIARQRIQQGQWNAQFGSQQDQWAAQFQAQQELNQANLTQQQRAQNDAYQQMLFGNYFNSQRMLQQNAFQNQNAQLQAQGINSGVSIANQQAQMAAANAQMQQGTALIGAGATMGAAGMTSGYFGGGGAGAATAAPAVANSGFNQSNPNKIDWGY